MSRTTIHRALSKALISSSKTPSNDNARQPLFLKRRLAREGSAPDGCKRLLHASSNTHELGQHDDIRSFEEEKNERKRLKDDLRALLREIAQPVAVVTSFLPTNEAGGSSSPDVSAAECRSSERDAGNWSLSEGKFHGATLSSFTSIAMDPYPLVAFALRIPSRMGTTLSSFSLAETSTSLTSHPMSNSSTSASHMVVNLLSATQASEAITFSRPDLYPTPFTSGSKSVAYKLSKDGLPVLDGVVGALSCKLVCPPIPLYDLDHFATPGEKAQKPNLGRGDVASELFIARVVRIEKVLPLEMDLVDNDRERTLPLIYHRRGYTSCHPTRPLGKEEKKT